MTCNSNNKKILFIALPLLLILTTLLITVLTFPPENNVSRAPGNHINVLFITIDALRADRFSFGGNTITELTPVLDKLIKDGVVFNDAYCVSACTPSSFAGIFTSRVPYWSPADKGEWNNKTVYGLTRFFDNNKERPGFPPSLNTIPVIFKRSGYTTVGISSNPYLSEEFGFERGFDFFEAPLNFEPPYAPAEKLTQKVKQYLSELRNKKFFIWYHLMDLHWPLLNYDQRRTEIRSKRVRTTYRPVSEWTITARQYMTMFGNKNIPGWKETDENYLKARDDYTLAYEANLFRLDQQIGIIMDTLKEYGLWEKTLIVILNDHGDEFMEHADFGHTGQLYEQIVRGIWIMHSPELFSTPVSVDGPVSHLDLLPTLVELLHLETDSSEFDGASLVPLLENKRNQKDEFGFGLFHLRGFITDGQFKLIVRNNVFRKTLNPIDRQRLGPRELYNLKSDPLEQHNLVDQFPKIADRLYSKLELAYQRRGIKFWASTGREGDSSREVGEASEDGITKETRERLKALGYLQ